MKRLRQAPLAVFLVAIGIIALALWWSGADKPRDMTAIVISCFSLLMSTFAVVVPDRRSKFDNTFALAKRWDEHPMLDAREILRAYLENVDGFCELLKREDPVASRAMAMLINFYWNISAALEEEWADPTYLSKRFGPGLEKWFPAMELYLQGASGRWSLAAMNSLRERWEYPRRALPGSKAPRDETG